MPRKDKKPRSQWAYEITEGGRLYHALYVVNDSLVVPTRKRTLKNRIGFTSVVSRKGAGDHTVLYVPIDEYKEAVRQRAAAGIDEPDHLTQQWDYKNLRIGKRPRSSVSLSGTRTGASCGVSPSVTKAAHGTAAGKSASARVLASKGKREAHARAAQGCRAPGYVLVPKAQKAATRKANKARMTMIAEATRTIYYKRGNKKSWTACTAMASQQLKRAGKL